MFEYNKINKMEVWFVIIEKVKVILFYRMVVDEWWKYIYFYII